MEKTLRPIPLDLLARWIFEEIDSSDTVLGIPKGNFAVPSPRLNTRLFGRELAAPLGVAAGPHTQLAQNIVASWLCGARFIELKTVQVLDEITVSRPCIDSADETYNCEWSQELKLEQSFQEYLKAWVLIHALAHKLGLTGPGTLFAMSVGYNLEGIRSPGVQRFIASVRDAGAALSAAVEAVAEVYPAVRDLIIPHQLSDHITLSTMHGCPPAEIERIARYLLSELGVNTWVKLNPTLLGPERLRAILNNWFNFDIQVPDSAFEHDPRFEDAMAMVKSLASFAASGRSHFGIKLSNTLEVVNHRSIFPAGEKMMYLSGRALHPLTLTLAEQVAEELDGQVPVSFCGGADAGSFADLVADGLSPVTVCTDLLKPGGYARLQQYLVNLEEAMDRVGVQDLEAFLRTTSGDRGARFNLGRHAKRVIGDERYARRQRPLTFKGQRTLGYFDCIAAPCQEACPAHQAIPDYLWLVAQRRPSQALEVILRTNPLPGVTGSICDHPCTERCVRNLYDAPLAIREVKRFAFEHGKAPDEKTGAPLNVKVAIVGAGPAGLAAAYALAKMGFEAVIFEARQTPGGMVSGVIPGYRLDGRAIGNDLDRLRQLGVRLELGKALGREFTLTDLRRDYRYVFLAVGAQKGKHLAIPGEEATGVIDALDFLTRVRAQTPLDLGQRILVVGGGNTAMDAARSARRLAKGGQVALVYRRSRAQMPADPAEVRDCLEEGIGLRDLLAPVCVVAEAGRVTGLVCSRMKLGEPDSSGRPRPVPTGAEETLAADTIVVAIGQEPVLDFLEGLNLQRRPDGSPVVDRDTCETSLPGLFAGGDLVRGAASVIQAVADGRAVAREIGRRHGVQPQPELALDKRVRPVELLERKSRRTDPQRVPVLPVAERGSFAEVLRSFDPETAAKEASRCLDCDDLCSLCVTVCPNRANTAYTTTPLRIELPSWQISGGRLVATGTKAFAVAQTVQIVNLADFCNQCGNCSTFCPTSGAPYRDKPRFWIDEQGYQDARDDAFRLERAGGLVAIEARLKGCVHRLERRTDAAEYRSDKLMVRLRPGSWEVLEWQPAGVLVEGEMLDLTTCAALIVLLQAESVVPGRVK